tara:strand:+ start:125 stop:385 length:261 start_codon:yes stop_codon:yes gene_type:complete
MGLYVRLTAISLSIFRPLQTSIYVQLVENLIFEGLKLIVISEPSYQNELVLTVAKNPNIFFVFTAAPVVSLWMTSTPSNVKVKKIE